MDDSYAREMNQELDQDIVEDMRRRVKEDPIEILEWVNEYLERELLEGNFFFLYEPVPLAPDYFEKLESETDFEWGEFIDEWENFHFQHRHLLYHALLVLTEELSVASVMHLWRRLRELDSLMGRSMLVLSPLVLGGYPSDMRDAMSHWKLYPGFNPLQPFPNTPYPESVLQAMNSALSK